MCAIDDCDRCDVWDVTQHRAAKPHECTECRRTIAKGEHYRRIGWSFEGSWGTMRLCTHCQIGADWLLAECGGFMADGVLEEIREHAEEYRRASLWKIVVGASKRWAKFGGSGLMPVPAMPPLSEHAPRAAQPVRSHK